MKKLLILFLITFSQISFAGNFSFLISNSMMSGVNQLGSIDLGTIDPFNPQLFCNNFIAPNSCTVLNRNNIQVHLNFNYSTTITNGTSVDVFFNLFNGNNGSGSFENIQAPFPLLGMQNGANNNFSLNFTIPIFGSNSRSHYELLVDMDVVLN